MRLFACVLSVAAVLAPAAPPLRAGPILTLDPLNGALAGLPGQTLGWGLTIQNDASGWLVITGVNFNQTTSIGDFSDFVTPQFLLYAVPPNETWTQAFDPIASSGLGKYVIDGSFAWPGDTAAGDLELSFDIHSIDPNGENYDPGQDMSTGSQALLPATVTYQTAPDVPEPATIATALAGLGLLGLVKAARRRS